jgi:hypothetical protein
MILNKNPLIAFVGLQYKNTGETFWNDLIT